MHPVSPLNFRKKAQKHVLYVRDFVRWCGGGGGGGGFFLACEDLGKIVSRLRFFFFFEVEISLHILIPLFTPGLVYSGSAS